MVTTEFQNVWKNIDSEINLKSTDELYVILQTKIRRTMNKFLVTFCIDVIVCVGLLVFLTITAMNRQADIIYMVNNSLLGLITLSALFISLFSLKKLQNNKSDLSVKDWLEFRIRLLSGWLSGKYSKLYVVLIPILIILINTSIHVYFEYKPFLVVMTNMESVYGQIAGFIVALAVSLYAWKKIRKYQLKNLEYLKSLLSALQ